MRRAGANRAFEYGGFAVLVMLVLSLGSTGCHKKKAARRAGLGVRCAIDARTIDEMARHDDLSTVSPEKRSLYFGLLLRQCKGWPSLVAKKVNHIVRSIELMGKQPTGPAPPKLTDADRADIDRRLNRLCPGYDKVAGKVGSKKSQSAARYNVLWKHCGLRRQGVLTRWEFVAHRPDSRLLVIMYNELVRGGMNRKAARLLVRLWMYGEHGDNLIDYKIALPVSRSNTRMTAAVDLVVSRTSILLRDRKVIGVTRGRVNDNAKRDGPDGFFIEPLFRKLRDEAKKLRAAEKQGGMAFRGDLVLAVDRRTPYRLLAEVFYTATQAGFKRYQILVSHPDEKYRVIVVQAPRVHRVGQPRPSYHISVSILSSALVAKRPSAATKLRFAFAPGRVDDAVRRLSLALWKNRARAKVSGAARDWGKAFIVPEPMTLLQDVVYLLDGLRVVPREAKDPPPPKGLSQPGCAFDFDRKQNEWKLPPNGAAGCLYPLPTLGLASD